MATIFASLILVSCPTPEDKQAEDILGTNTDIPAVGTKYDDEENNLRYIVNDDRALSVIEPIDSGLADWVCIIPEKYEGMKVTSIGDKAFILCSGLTSITIPDSVTSIGDSAFFQCTSLSSVTIGSSVTSIGQSAFYGCTGFTSIVIPDSVTSLGDSSFYECTSLSSVTIGSSVTSIGNRTFTRCTGLISIDIPDSVTSIDDYAFYDCSGLERVSIGNGVTSIGEKTFQYCSIEIVTIGNGITSIEEDAFSRCFSLTKICIDKPKNSVPGAPWSANTKWETGDVHKDLLIEWSNGTITY